jgi:long-chain acyl-CoA synthetase
MASNYITVRTQSVVLQRSFGKPALLDIDMFANLAIYLIRSTLLIWDVVSFPASLMIYRPWKFQERSKRKRAEIISQTESSITVEPLKFSCDLRDEILSLEDPLDTIPKLFDFAIAKQGRKPCLGTRELLDQEVEVQPNGKELIKVTQGEYVWKTYCEVGKEIIDTAKGLREIGIQERAKLALFADTKSDWLITALACFKNNIPIVTLYTNLGEEGVLHGLLETKVATIVTSQELLPRVAKILERAELISTVIVFENKVLGDINFSPFDNRRLIPFSRLAKIGETSNQIITPPGPDDLAILMYTSGSTGLKNFENIYNFKTFGTLRLRFSA